MGDLVLYAGPTLSRLGGGLTSTPGGVELRPPIGRGDLERLINERPPGNVAIVDGTFHLGRLAVRHQEIRLALERGWQVFGLSSMGALRAAEMTSLGMRGFGRVFARFRDEPDLRDDEVALLHEPEPPYRELSEPLIHQRAALADWVARGELDADRAAAIASDLEGRWFGERTLARLRDALRAAGVARADELVRDFAPHRLKVLDLADFLAERPWTR
jgi:hypothetical protein